MLTIKRVLIFSAIVISSFLASCGTEQEQKEKPLVYEGMSSQELRNKLGDPLSIDSSGQVFDAQHKKKLILEKWKYEKRIVLIINDTVKDTNLN